MNKKLVPVEARECGKHGMTDHALRDNGTRWRCKRCTVERVAKRRDFMIETIIAEHGGACIGCGYNRNRAALTFHHRDRSTKKFSISSNGYTYALERMRAEADKCDLLCLNCHAEHHHPRLQYKTE